MSVRVMSLIWDRFPGSGSELLAMLALADFGNDQGGSIHPSMATIAAKVRLTKSQARRVVHNLIADGWIGVVGNETGGAHGSTRQYQLNIERLNETASAHATPTASADARGSTGARDGSHPCAPRVAPMRVTGSAHATQTIINHHEPLLTTTLDVSGKPPTCPHQKIIELYDKTLPELPRVRIWNETRKGYLRSRWRESEDRQQLDWWKKYFEYVNESDFLTGRTNGKNGKPPFIADLEWLIKPNNFAKIIEGKYHRGTE